MKRHIKHILFLLIFVARAQEPGAVVLDFREYLGYVKAYHPVARQAALVVDAGQANLMRSRGGFDPKIEVDYDRKEFKGATYYDRLNATFKIPTWYGIELKGNFEQNEGDYLNPGEIVPEDGLYSAGVSMSVGQGFWINERMATLKQARIFREQSRAERDLQVNQILYEASMAYFEWLQAYQDGRIYEDFYQNARARFEGVKTGALAGEVAAIDTVEARIAVQDRRLGLEQAKVRLMKKSLQVSNFLWMGDNIPVELQPNVIPDIELEGEIDLSLEIAGKPLENFTIENHPKLISLGYKIDGLQVDTRLKANKLLPTLELEYNLLTEKPNAINSFATQEYKGGVSFRMPLFLRKERGDLKLAKLKLKEAALELESAHVKVRNEVTAIYRELESYETQKVLIEGIVNDNRALVAAEERKFSFGESSLFLINSRESKLIDAKLKQNEVRFKFFSSKAKLFQSLAVNPENL